MTSKLVTFNEVKMSMLIKRLTDYTVQHFSGIDDVPHLCVKVRHSNGFAWFGLSIIPQDGILSKRWSPAIEESVRTKFLAAMAQIIDLAEMDSDVSLLMRSIQDICTGRKRPVLFGGGVNEFIQISSTNNIQIELYRHDVKPESTTYGGYFMTVEYGDNTYPVMVYHRGVILYNYITKEAISNLMFNELRDKFPEVFPDILKLSIPYNNIIQVPRNRNKREKIK